VLLPIARGAPIVAERVGFRRVAPVGLILIGLGFALLSQLRLDTPYWFFLVGLLLFAAGMGLAGTPSTTAITAALPMSKQGVASALNDVSRELGSAFGIAILGSVLNQAYRDGMSGAVANLPPQIGERILSSVAFVSVPEVHQLPGADQLIATAQQAFLIGVTSAVFVGSMILFVAAVVVFFLAPAREQAESDQAVKMPAAA
jgi:fucose permease